jgi:lipopolysaccharide/colanic/teichoic acid biosynthesis glycosyltransferase
MDPDRAEGVMSPQQTLILEERHRHLAAGGIAWAHRRAIAWRTARRLAWRARVDLAPRLKRGLDLVGAALLVLLSAPVLTAIAVAIKLEDGGPVLFRQTRVGRHGRLFVMLKFRSMVPDAEAAVGAVQASARDPRVTRVGRFMRATALDELPQLWNIFCGDMSVVGPRALRPGEIEARGPGALVRSEEIPGYAERISVRPGLTGLAQVFAPRDIPRRQKFRYDCVYIRGWSFGLDLRLVALSFWITLRGAWGKQGREAGERGSCMT